MRSHWIVAVLAIVAVVVLRRVFDWQGGEWTFVLGLLALWALAGAVVSVFRRPDTMDSLLLLDRRGGWKDRFSSAWYFLHGSENGEGEKLHLTRAGELLPTAVAAFPSAFPFPRLRWIWVAPLLALIFAILPVWRIPPDASELLLTSGMQDAAALQSDQLLREAELVKDLESLTKEEMLELEALRTEVDQVAQDLAEAEGLTAGEVLEALEDRARASERLAEKLGMGSEDWASAEMIAEMASHPDTADLAVAIKDKAASPAAEESMKLYATLDRSGITRETEERMTRALEQVMGAATDEDGEKPVGERVGNASRKLLAASPKTAAREFEELAKHFRLLETREEAREKLENLAEALRDAGGEISGSELEKMEEIAAGKDGDRAAPEGMQSIDTGELPEDLKNLLSPQMASSGQQGTQPNPGQQQGRDQNDQNGQQPAPVPGMASAEGQQPGGDSGGEGKPGESPAQQPNLSAPVPGESPPDSDAGEGGKPGEESRDGQGQGGQLAAPVPGSSDAANQSVAMSGGSSGQVGQGGNEAGSGTAEMIDQETEALKYTRDSEVVAQVGKGDSVVRAVQGQVRQEKATRSRQEVVTDFLAAEEQALDEQALPQSRRKHVLRYFSEIRRQFEAEEKE